MFFIRQGATHKVVLGPAVAVANGYVPVTSLALSSADEAEVILHDNGTVVDISGYTWAAITTADGYYHLTLQSGISGTVGHMTVVVNDDSLCLPLRQDFTVLEEAVYDQLFAASAPGAATAAALATAQLDLDTLTGSDGATLATTQGNYAPAKAGDLMGLANDAITAAKYDESTAFPITAANGSQFTEAGGTGDHLTALATQASVDTIDDFLDTEIADILAAVDTEIAAIIATLGTDGDGLSAIPWNADWDAQVQSEVEDALTAARLESSAVPAANASLVDKIRFLATLARNKITNDGSDQVLYADDGSTPVATASVGESGGTVTRGEYA